MDPQRGPGPGAGTHEQQVQRAEETKYWANFPVEALMFDPILSIHAFFDIGAAGDTLDSPASVRSGTKTKTATTSDTRACNDDDLLMLENSIDGDEADQQKAYLERVSNQLFELDVTDRDIAHGGSSFFFHTHRRQTIVQHVHKVLSDAIKKKHDSSNNIRLMEIGKIGVEDGSPEGEQCPNPTLRIVVLSIFPLIKSLSRTDPELKREVLQILANTLHSLPLLSLQNEPGDCLGSFRDLVQSMTSSMAARSPSEQGDAVSALVGLALHQGRLSHILSSVVTMLGLDECTREGCTAPINRSRAKKRKLSSPTTKKDSPKITLSIDPFLRLLAAFRPKNELPIADSSSFICSWHHHSPNLSTKGVHAFSSCLAKHDSYYRLSGTRSSKFQTVESVASDGYFLYLYSSWGFLKVGSGKHGTLVGHVYKSKMRASSKSDESNVSTALHVQGAILYTSRHLLFISWKASMSKACYSSNDGKDGDRRDLGMRVLDPTTLDETDTILFEMPDDKITPSYLSFTTDGQYVYGLYFGGDDFDADCTQPSCVDVFSLGSGVDTLVFTRTVTLANAKPPKGQNTVMPDSSARSPSSSKRESSMVWRTYCTGLAGYFVRISSPSQTTSDTTSVFYNGRTSTRSQHHIYDTTEGCFVHSSLMSSDSHILHRASPIGFAMCYDSFNGLIWGYASESMSVRCWRYCGGKNQREYVEVYHDVSPGFVLSSTCLSSQTSSGSSKPTKSSKQRTLNNLYNEMRDTKYCVPASACILFHIRRLTQSYEPGHDPSWSTRQPMCIDICQDTFKLLNSIISTYIRTLTGSNISVPAFASIFIALGSCLSILRINLIYAAGCKLDIPCQLCDKLKDSLLSLVYVTLGDPRTTEYVRTQALQTLMGGLTFFYPNPEDLENLLKGPLCTLPIVVDHLLSSDCLSLAVTPQRLESLLKNGAIRTILKATQNDLISDENGKWDASPATDGLSDRVTFVLSGISPILSSPLQLLSKLQQYILCQFDDADDVGRKIILNYCCEVFESACATCRLQQSFKNKLSQAQIDHLLCSSSLAILVPSIINVLARNEATLSEVAYDFLKSVGELLQVVDTYNEAAQSAIIDNAERQLMNMRDDDRYFEDRSVQIESSHPYVSHQFSRKVIIEGSDFLIITFDPKCASVGRDVLRLTGPDGRHLPGIPYPLSGPSHKWPKCPIIVNGNSVTITWSADSYPDQGIAESQNAWGFRCTIKGFKPCHPVDVPWSLDLEISLARLGGRCVQALLSFRGKPSGQEDDIISSILNSNTLLSEQDEQGVPHHTSKQKKFVRSVVQGTGAGQALVDFCFKKVPGRPMLGGVAKKIVPKAEKEILATILHHSGLVDDALWLSLQISKNGNASKVSAQGKDIGAIAKTPQFKSVSKAFKQLYRAGKTLVRLCRLFKCWQDCINNGSEVEGFFQNLESDEIQFLCGFKGISYFKSDESKSVSQLMSVLAKETKVRQDEKKDPLSWTDAYVTVCDRVSDCAAYLRTQSPHASTSIPDIGESMGDDYYFEMILSYLTSACESTRVQQAFQARRFAAEARVFGLESLKILMASVHFTSARNCILMGLGEHMRNHWILPGERFRGPHYLHNVQGCSQRQNEKLRVAISDLHLSVLHS